MSFEMIAIPIFRRETLTTRKHQTARSQYATALEFVAPMLRAHDKVEMK
jgi:hypothetical protein